MVLLVGSGEDPHISAVADVLARAACLFRIFDCLAKEPTGIFGPVSDCAELKLGSDSTSVAEIKSVWWRQKPKSIDPNVDAGDLYDSQFITREWMTVQEYLGIVLEDVYCINPRAQAVKANNKLYQLELAAKRGFRTPRSLISNNPESASAFLKSLDGSQAIFKTLTPYMNPAGKATYTTIVDDGTIEQFSAGLKACPGIFQEFVPKQFELRITVVEQEVFAAKINSNATPESSVDWRKRIFDDMYEAYILPDIFHAQLLRLHADFGLVYGAYDFIVDKDGTPIFVEVNPAGQWLWIEERLGYPISERVAQALMRNQRA